MHGKQCKMWWFSVNSLVLLFKLQSFIRALLVPGRRESRHLLLLVEMHWEFIVGTRWRTSGRDTTHCNVCLNWEMLFE